METVRRVQTWVDEIGAWIDEVRDTNIKKLIWDNLIKISDTISRIAFVKKDKGLTIEITDPIGINVPKLLKPAIEATMRKCTIYHCRTAISW